MYKYLILRYKFYESVTIGNILYEYYRLEQNVGDVVQVKQNEHVCNNNYKTCTNANELKYLTNINKSAYTFGVYLQKKL